MSKRNFHSRFLPCMRQVIGNAPNLWVIPPPRNFLRTSTLSVKNRPALFHSCGGCDLVIVIFFFHQRVVCRARDPPTLTFSPAIEMSVHVPKVTKRPLSIAIGGTDFDHQRTNGFPASKHRYILRDPVCDLHWQFELNTLPSVIRPVRHSSFPSVLPFLTRQSLPPVCHHLRHPRPSFN